MTAPEPRPPIPTMPTLTTSESCGSAAWTWGTARAAVVAAVVVRKARRVVGIGAPVGWRRTEFYPIEGEMFRRPAGSAVRLQVLYSARSNPTDSNVLNDQNREIMS